MKKVLSRDIDVIDYREVGSRIRNLRLKRNITQRELSHLTDISPQHIANIESGKARPSVETLVIFSNILETTTDYFLSDIIATQQETRFQKELEELLEDCSPTERKILLKNLATLKTILKDTH